VLRELARDRDKLEKETILRMTRSKILLGSRRVKRDGGDPSIGDDKEDWHLQDDLLLPSDVVIVDDTNAYQLFGDRIFFAPQDDILESTHYALECFRTYMHYPLLLELYFLLGSSHLSSLITEDYRTSSELPDSNFGDGIRHLILDRLPLFLHKQSPSRIKLSSDWLNNENNFIVKVFENISVIKSLRHGDIHESTSYDTSAIAKQVDSGRIELWLAGNKEPKMHE